MQHTDGLDKLAVAFSAFQAEITDPIKDKQGYGYKYTDLHQVLEIARPILSKNGLSILQGGEDCEDPTKTKVTTILLHSSGQWVSATLTVNIGNVKGLSPAQELGVVLTYARRYAAMMMLGLASVNDDEDGKLPKNNTKNSVNLISDSHLKELSNLIIEKNIGAEKLDEWLLKSKVKVISQLTDEKAVKMIEYLRSQNV